MANLPDHGHAAIPSLELLGPFNLFPFMSSLATVEGKCVLNGLNIELIALVLTQTNSQKAISSFFFGVRRVITDQI